MEEEKDHSPQIAEALLTADGRWGKESLFARGEDAGRFPHPRIPLLHLSSRSQTGREEERGHGHQDVSGVSGEVGGLQWGRHDQFTWYLCINISKVSKDKKVLSKTPRAENVPFGKFCILAAI